MAKMEGSRKGSMRDGVGCYNFAASTLGQSQTRKTTLPPDLAACRGYVIRTYGGGQLAVWIPGATNHDFDQIQHHLRSLMTSFHHCSKEPPGLDTSKPTETRLQQRNDGVYWPVCS